MKHIPIPRNLKAISKHRQFLYGFAALWIMFYHMGSKVPEGWLPLSFFQSTGAGGVEVFLLLTGLGLYSSMRKDARLSSFYGKRFMRVFLPAFILLAIMNLAASHRLVGYLGSITFLGHWVGADTAWYVCFILTMYLFYPMVFALTKKNRKALYVGAIFFLALSFVFEAMPNGPRDGFLRMVSRIPVFLVGCALAPFFEENKRLPRWFLPGSIIITIPLMWLFKVMAERGFLYSFRAMAYFFYAIDLVIVVSTIAELLSRSAISCLLYRFFAFCGQISLEIYLLFSRLRGLLSKLPGFSMHACGGAKLDVASAICTIILAVVLQNIVQCIHKTYTSVRIPEPERD